MKTLPSVWWNITQAFRVFHNVGLPLNRKINLDIIYLQCSCKWVYGTLYFTLLSLSLMEKTQVIIPFTPFVFLRYVYNEHALHLQ